MLYGAYDTGSRRTLAVWMRHASRTRNRASVRWKVAVLRAAGYTFSEIGTSPQSPKNKIEKSMDPMNRNISHGVVALLIVCFLGTSLMMIAPVEDTDAWPYHACCDWETD